MIVGKINLAALKHVLMEKKGKDGMVQGIFIPIEANHIFKSEKGNVYLDLIAFDAVNEEYKQTHMVKQSLPKEVREAMSEEEQRSQRILGHLNTKVGKTEDVPNSAADGVIGEDDDLPF